MKLVIIFLLMSKKCVCMHAHTHIHVYTTYIDIGFVGKHLKINMVISMTGQLATKFNIFYATIFTFTLLHQ